MAITWWLSLTLLKEMYKNRRNRPPHACCNIQWDHGWSFVSDPFYNPLCFQTSTGISLKYHQCLHFHSHLRKNIPKSYNTMHKELSPHLSHILRLCPLVLVSPPGKKSLSAFNPLKILCLTSNSSKLLWTKAKLTQALFKGQHCNPRNQPSELINTCINT